MNRLTEKLLKTYTGPYCVGQKLLYRYSKWNDNIYTVEGYSFYEHNLWIYVSLNDVTEHVRYEPSYWEKFE